MKNAIVEVNSNNDVNVDDSGVGTMSLNMVSKGLGVSQPALSKMFKSWGKSNVFKAMGDDAPVAPYELVNGTYMVGEDVITALTIYYALDAGRYTTGEARNSLAIFAKVGVRAFIQDLAGYTHVAVDDNKYKELLESYRAMRESAKYHLEQADAKIIEVQADNIELLSVQQFNKDSARAHKGKATFWRNRAADDKIKARKYDKLVELQALQNSIIES